MLIKEIKKEKSTRNRYNYFVKSVIHCNILLFPQGIIKKEPRENLSLCFFFNAIFQTDKQSKLGDNNFSRQRYNIHNQTDFYLLIYLFFDYYI